MWRNTNESKSSIYGCYENNSTIGLLRYKLDDCNTVVSIFLAPEQQGKGDGEQLLAPGDDWMAVYHASTKVLKAEIRPDLESSEKNLNGQDLI